MSPLYQIIFILTSIFGFGLSLEAWKAYTECGGVVPVSVWHRTVISYKLGQKYLPDEFCVWTLQAHGQIDTFQLKITQNMDQTGARRDGLVAYFWTSSGLISHQLSLTNTTLDFEAPISFLAFSSDCCGAGTGFEIQILCSGKPNSAALNTKAYHIEKDEGRFSYPEKPGSLYKNNEHVSIVVFRERQDPDYIIDMKMVKVADVDLEKDRDVVLAYEFGGYWQERFCALMGNVTGAEEIAFAANAFYHMLFLFSSDHNITGTGFTIEWEHFPFKVKI